VIEPAEVTRSSGQIQRLEWWQEIRSSPQDRKQLLNELAKYKVNSELVFGFCERLFQVE
jgi:hypothetical protein